MNITKKIIGIGLITIAIGLYSCVKEEVQPNQKQTQSTKSASSKSQLIKLSKEYRSSNTVTNKVAPWLAIVGADIGGMLTGGVAGGGLGFKLGGVQGGLIGLGIGGALGGAAASIEEAGEVIEGMATTPPNAVPGSSFPANTANPQDDMGRLHYDFLHTYVSGQNNPDVQHSYPFLVNSYSIEMDMTTSEVMNYYSLQQCQTDVNSVMNFPGNSEDYVIQLFNNEDISQDVRDHLVPYAQAFDASNPQNSNDVDNFVSYSINAENIVNNSDLLTDQDKSLILGYMSTARYGVQYWFQYQNTSIINTN